MIAHVSDDLADATQLLLIDVGNTRIGMATSVGGRRTPAMHLAARPFEPVAAALGDLWGSFSEQDSRALIISSVCPQTFEQVQAWCRDNKVGPVLVIGKDIEAPISADVAAPDKVGTDRLCAAAAAYTRIKSACVVADFGTALTVDLVADNGVFLGGTILPGMQLSARALHEHTALLPLVEITPSTEILGKDTQSAIRNGIFAMMCGALREITERYATDIGRWPPLVLTGGDAPAIAEACEFVDHVVPDLCLEGVALAYQQSVKPID